jgi:sterol desaturase/sphingolipid hydroxylase (fatty acid hydroxylase superfamily)
MIVFVAFWILMLLTAANPSRWQLMQAQTWQDWILDLTGLLIQGLVIPILQVTVVYQFYQVLIPDLRASLHLHPVAAFLLSFVGVDYLYYWNHRLLHTTWLWPLHKIHHTMTERNILGTSRNSLWTSFCIIYLWVHALSIYLIADPTWYLIGVSLTSALDLWRHSEIEPKPGSFLHGLLSPWLILPCDHAWHHSNNSEIGNYGANFKLWDIFHGTACIKDFPPDRLGFPTQLTLVEKLLFPYSRVR